MAPRVRRHRRLLVILGAVVGVVILAVGGFLLAGTRRPAWYHPAPPDRARLHEDKAALAGLQEQISAALNAGREARFVLDEAQVNRWLAARAEIWPQLALDLGPLEQPQIRLRDGRLEVAASGRAGGMRVVGVLGCSVAVAEDTLVIRLDPLKVGALTAPRDWVSDILARPATRRGVVIDRRAGTITLDNDWVWPNGKRRCRLRELEIGDGVATVGLEPLRTGRRPE